MHSPCCGASGPGLDRDQDGVPDAFDVANSGKLVLNSLVPVRGAAADRIRFAPDGPAFTWMSQIFLPIDQTLNADAAGVSTPQIDSMLASQLNLKGLNIPPGDLVELDCTGLSYCSPGGSGHVVTGFDPAGGFQTAPFNNYIDTSGFGVLRGPGAAPLLQGPSGAEEFSLMPGATSSEIKTGDTPILRITSSGTLVQAPEPIDFVFNTVPALASWSDSAGDSGAVDYPASSSSPGTQSNPITLHHDANGSVVVTMTVYPPQRAGIAGAGEPAFMDIGNLAYRMDLPSQNPNPGTPTSPQCTPDSLSTTDPSLSIQSQGGAGMPAMGQFIDQRGDRPADASDKLTMTLNLSQCLADKGQATIAPGTPLHLEIEADPQQAADHANQQIFFLVQG